MKVTAEVEAAELGELVKQVQAGNEVLLTQGNKPVARLIAAGEISPGKGATLRIRSFKGHKVLTPVIPQAELANEIFGRP